MIRASSFAGKTVAVFGLGRSGNATCRALVAGGATVAAWDDGTASRAETERLGYPLVDLAAADWSQFAALILAPGVPLTHPTPHWTVARAREAGVEIIGDIEIFFRERALHCPASPVIAITGTNGKSTTTALIAHVLSAAGLDAQMGGNIGVPILDLEPPSPARIHVIEMSSFQIDLTPSLAPTIGVLLNVTADHLDRHGPAADTDSAMRNYSAIKERLVRSAVIAAIGVDDDISREILGRKIADGAAVAFSASHQLAPGYSMSGSDLVCANRDGLAVRLGTTEGIATLRGRHNAQNALAAVAAIRECASLVGFSAPIDLAAGLASYPGLPHRMEQVGQLATAGGGRMVFINDSKATNADSTEKALASFDSDIYWIIGGKPKEGGIASLEPYFSRVAKAYLIGAASAEFAATLDGKVAYDACNTLDVAIRKASDDALRSAAAEPVVLLSPACASYDQFKSFEHRGDRFRELVRALIEFYASGRPAMIEFSRTDRSRIGEWWLTVDRGLLTAFITLLTIGLMVTPAASPGVAVRKGFTAFHFVERQIVFAGLALFVLLAVSLARPATIRRGAAVLFAISVAAMIFVLMAGDEINGARRWIRLGGLSLQPSEFAKPAFVVLAAWAFGEALRRRDVPALPLAVGLYGLLAIVLVQQPDVGQTVLATLVWGTLLFLSGQPLRWAAALGVAGIAGLAVAYATLDYIRARVERFLNPVPGDNSQVGRALQSFIEGGFFGRGPGEGTIKTSLPDAHTDFVLAVIAEEYGVLACLVVLGLFAFIATRSIRRGLLVGDAGERLAIIGLALMISAQALINMGVNVGLLPAKGMTLPFISAGGSSTVAMALAAGVILALTRRQPLVSQPEPMILPPSLRLDQPGHSLPR